MNFEFTETSRSPSGHCRRRPGVKTIPATFSPHCFNYRYIMAARLGASIRFRISDPDPLWRECRRNEPSARGSFFSRASRTLPLLFPSLLTMLLLPMALRTPRCTCTGSGRRRKNTRAHTLCYARGLGVSRFRGCSGAEEVREDLTPRLPVCDVIATMLEIIWRVFFFLFLFVLSVCFVSPARDF